MSAYIKGTRRPKPPVFRDLKIGNFEIPFSVIIILLFAVLYLLCLVGGTLESGTDALTLQVASFAIFALFAYSVRKNMLQLKPFITIIDIFLGLSVIPLFWSLVQFFNIYTPARTIGAYVPADIFVLALMSLITVILSVIIVAMVLYYEKGKLNEIYVRAGNIKAGIITGVAGFAACCILSLVVIIFLGNVDISRLPPIFAALGVFSLTAALAEELWFRGILLSRLLPLAGRNTSLLIQTAVFAVFEAMIAYTLMPQAFYVLIVLIASVILGYYWGGMTIKNNSILGATLFHAGFYILMTLPVIL
jgi:uncharacterized protein